MKKLLVLMVVIMMAINGWSRDHSLDGISVDTGISKNDALSAIKYHMVLVDHENTVAISKYQLFRLYSEYIAYVVFDPQDRHIFLRKFFTERKELILSHVLFWLVMLSCGFLIRVIYKGPASFVLGIISLFVAVIGLLYYMSVHNWQVILIGGILWIIGFIALLSIQWYPKYQQRALEME